MFEDHVSSERQVTKSGEGHLLPDVSLIVVHLASIQLPSLGILNNFQTTIAQVLMIVLAH